MKIGIVAPSSVVSSIELKLGIERLESEGFSVRVHPQCRRKFRYLAGSDEERASAFFEYAADPSLDIVYCARGGYGAMRILPLLEKMAAGRGVPPRKMLIGSSDATALLEFVRTRWGWASLHSPMPGLRSYVNIQGAEFAPLVGWMRGEPMANPWGKGRLKVLRELPSAGVRGELVGGNLTVWTSLLATPFAGRAAGKILFFEDIGEKLYRLDRMLSQLDLSGGFTGVKAIVLGDYLDCDDTVAQGLVRMPSPARMKKVLAQPAPKDLAPLRPRLNGKKVIPDLFREIAKKHSIPLVSGLPVGHGPGRASLPLGAEYLIKNDGQFALASWDWIK